MLFVRLDHEIEIRLNDLCEVTGLSKSYYAKLAIKKFLDDREDYLKGIAVLEKQEPTISLEEFLSKIMTNKTPPEQQQPRPTHGNCSRKGGVHSKPTMPKPQISKSPQGEKT